ncbi:MAG TPA: helix-turn-helix domain-containing protein [Desulfitobacteriaceae bacterium]|nr:helix-turn-helix domain-containing protein [Desulfitobacteriaceae bacterium]
MGNFSKLTQVSVRMLRYYDEHGLLKPDHTDKFTGYRLYSVRQLPELQKIIMLRDMNFSVAEITEILKNWSDDFLIGQLQKKIQETEQSILSGQRLIEKIQTSNR